MFLCISISEKKRECLNPPKHSYYVGPGAASGIGESVLTGVNISEEKDNNLSSRLEVKRSSQVWNVGICQCRLCPLNGNLLQITIQRILRFLSFSTTSLKIVIGIFVGTFKTEVKQLRQQGNWSAGFSWQMGNSASKNLQHSSRFNN